MKKMLYICITGYLFVILVIHPIGLSPIDAEFMNGMFTIFASPVRDFFILLSVIVFIVIAFLHFRKQQKDSA